MGKQIRGVREYLPGRNEVEIICLSEVRMPYVFLTSFANNQDVRMLFAVTLFLFHHYVFVYVFSLLNSSLLKNTDLLWTGLRRVRMTRDIKCWVGPRVSEELFFFPLRREVSVFYDGGKLKQIFCPLTMTKTGEMLIAPIFWIKRKCSIVHSKLQIRAI